MHSLILQRSLLSLGHFVTLMAAMMRISVEIHVDIQADQQFADRALPFSEKQSMTFRWILVIKVDKGSVEFSVFPI